MNLLDGQATAVEITSCKKLGERPVRPSQAPRTVCHEKAGLLENLPDVALDHFKFQAMAIPFKPTGQIGKRDRSLRMTTGDRIEFDRCPIGEDHQGGNPRGYRKAAVLVEQASEPGIRTGYVIFLAKGTTTRFVKLG